MKTESGMPYNPQVDDRQTMPPNTRSPFANQLESSEDLTLPPDFSEPEDLTTSFADTSPAVITQGETKMKFQKGQKVHIFFKKGNWVWEETIPKAVPGTVIKQVMIKHIDDHQYVLIEINGVPYSGKYNPNENAIQFSKVDVEQEVKPEELTEAVVENSTVETPPPRTSTAVDADLQSEIFAPADDETTSHERWMPPTEFHQAPEQSRSSSMQAPPSFTEDANRMTAAYSSAAVQAEVERHQQQTDGTENDGTENEGGKTDEFTPEHTEEMNPQDDSSAVTVRVKTPTQPYQAIPVEENEVPFSGTKQSETVSPEILKKAITDASEIYPDQLPQKTLLPTKWFAFSYLLIVVLEMLGSMHALTSWHQKNAFIEMLALICMFGFPLLLTGMVFKFINRVKKNMTQKVNTIIFPRNQTNTFVRWVLQALKLREQQQASAPVNTQQPPDTTSEEGDDDELIIAPVEVTSVSSLSASMPMDQPAPAESTEESRQQENKWYQRAMRHLNKRKEQLSDNSKLLIGLTSWVAFSVFLTVYAMQSPDAWSLSLFIGIAITALGGAVIFIIHDGIQNWEPVPLVAFCALFVFFGIIGWKALLFGLFKMIPLILLVGFAYLIGTIYETTK